MVNYNDMLKKMTTAKTEKVESKFSKDFLKTDIFDNTIIGRFLPDVKTMIKTGRFEAQPFEYCSHGWTSKEDGVTGLFVTCPNTFNEKCPICKQSVLWWKGSDPVQKELSKAIRRRQNYLVNFYVVSNPANPSDNGTVKLLRFGKQIHSRYLMATEGDDKDFYGDRIWKLTSDGCSFRIKCEKSTSGSKNVGSDTWPSYINSSFLPAGPLPGVDSEDRINEILGATIAIPEQYEKVSYADLEAMLKQHFLCSDIGHTIEKFAPSVPSSTVIQSAKASHTVENDESDSVVTESTTQKSAPQGSDEDQIDSLLAELQGLV